MQGEAERFNAAECLRASLHRELGVLEGQRDEVLHRNARRVCAAGGYCVEYTPMLRHRIAWQSTFALLENRRPAHGGTDAARQGEKSGIPRGGQDRIVE